MVSHVPIATYLCRADGDGHHGIQKPAKFLSKQKGTESIALITDCVSAGGLEDGDYMLGEFPVVVAMELLASNHNLSRFYSQTQRRFENVVD